MTKVKNDKVKDLIVMMIEECETWDKFMFLQDAINMNCGVDVLSIERDAPLLLRLAKDDAQQIIRDEMPFAPETSIEDQIANIVEFADKFERRSKLYDIIVDGYRFFMVGNNLENIKYSVIHYMLKEGSSMAYILTNTSVLSIEQTMDIPSKFNHLSSGTMVDPAAYFESIYLKGE